MNDDPVARRFRGRRLEMLRESHRWEWASQRLVLNDELRAEHIPDADDAAEDLLMFALTYDGYVALGTLEACGDLANTTHDRWARTGSLPPGLGLTELRSCLFFEQRRHHWADTDLGKERPYWMALIDAIRALVTDDRL